MEQKPPKRFYKMMADYGCFPLWVNESEGVRNVDPGTLGLTPELADELSSWAKDFDSTLNQSDPARSGFHSLEARSRFDARGRALWERLQTELIGAAVVSYYSIVERQELKT